MEPDRYGFEPEDVVVEKRRLGTAFVCLGFAAPFLVFGGTYVLSAGWESEYGVLFAGTVGVLLGPVIGALLAAIGAAFRRSSKRLAQQLEEEAAMARPPGH
jgi:hypothetical protein